MNRPSGSGQLNVEWLRAAVRKGLDAIGQGDYTDLNSEQEIKDFLRQIREEVCARVANER